MSQSFELLFLGTGADDWNHCPKGEAKYSLDKKIKRTSSLLINGNILIDPAPESYFFAKEVLKLDLSNVTDILLTHSHSDHFNLKSLESFVNVSRKRINFYCHESVLPLLHSYGIRNKVKLHPLKSYTTITISDISVKVLEANHEIVETRETPVHYIFEKKNKKWFYGCDGGWFLSRTWSSIIGKNLDLVVMDATVGNKISDFRIASHNTLPMLKLLIPAMKENGVMKEDAKILLSHMALTLYDGSEDYGDMISTYDGMRILL